MFLGSQVPGGAPLEQIPREQGGGCPSCKGGGGPRGLQTLRTPACAHSHTALDWELDRMSEGALRHLGGTLRHLAVHWDVSGCAGMSWGAPGRLGVH